MNLSELKRLPIAELIAVAEAQKPSVDNASRMSQQDLIFFLLKAHAKKR
jgi:transcription termination factor Rho